MATTDAPTLTPPCYIIAYSSTVTTMDSANTSRSPQSGRSAEEDALYQVLSIEREAQAIISEAEDEAARLVDQARQQADALVRQAQQSAQQQASEASAAALREAQTEAARILASTEAELASWERAAQPRIDEAAARVCRLVAFGRE